MVVPVPSTIPDSLLSPHQVNQKFHSSAMAGLGVCDWVDEDMICTPDTTTSSTNTSLQPDGSCWAFDPFCNSTMSQAPSVTGSYMTEGGNIVVMMSDGTQQMLHPDGSHGPVSGTYNPMGGTVTAAQSTGWAQLIQSLVNAGVRIGTVANLPAGASLTPNGTIVGSGQSLIRPGVITSNTLTSALSTLTSSPLLMIGGFGLLAILLLSGGRR